MASALRVRGGGLVKLHRKENANVEREQKQDVTIFCQNCICGAAYWHEEEIYFNLAFIAARARVCLLLVHLAFIGIYWLPTQACCEAGRAPASLSPVPQQTPHHHHQQQSSSFPLGFVKNLGPCVLTLRQGPESKWQLIAITDERRAVCFPASCHGRSVESTCSQVLAEGGRIGAALVEWDVGRGGDDRQDYLPSSITEWQ